jgi:hypothetical protein
MPDISGADLTQTAGTRLHLGDQGRELPEGSILYDNEVRAWQRAREVTSVRITVSGVLIGWASSWRTSIIPIDNVPRKAEEKFQTPSR